MAMAPLGPAGRSASQEAPGGGRAAILARSAARRRLGSPRHFQRCARPAVAAPLHARACFALVLLSPAPPISTAARARQQVPIFGGPFIPPRCSFARTYEAEISRVNAAPSSLRALFSRKRSRDRWSLILPSVVCNLWKQCDAPAVVERMKRGK